MASSGILAMSSFGEGVGEITSRNVNILATGRPGTGKSAVINCLIGEEVAPESCNLEQKTFYVTKYSRNVDMITFDVWDTPGIEPSSEGETDRFTSIARKVPEVDLVIFCTKMDDEWLNKHDIDTIVHFTEAFGEGIWEHAVFALTFANKVLPALGRTANDPNTVLEFFQGRLQRLDQQLKDALRKSRVNEEVIEKVCIVPFGHRERSLPGRKDWLSDFWSVCLKTMKECAQPALLQVNKNRLKEAQAVTPEDYQLPIYRQPIIIDTVKKTAIPGIIGATIGAYVFGPTGFLLGSMIGAGAGYFFNQ